MGCMRLGILFILLLKNINNYINIYNLFIPKIIMKIATGHEEENLKLYAVQYTKGESIVKVEHYIGSNEKDILSEIEKYRKEISILFRPKISSIKEVTHPDYNINLER